MNKAILTASLMSLFISLPALSAVRPVSGTVRTLQSATLQSCLRNAKSANDAAVRAANRISNLADRNKALATVARNYKATVALCYRSVNPDAVLDSIR